MSRYVWCEDSGSGFEFWKALFSALGPDIIVESKKNNTGLRKAVSDIEENDNQYYVLIDNAVDNPDVYREVKKINDISNGKRNVVIVKVHSFEFVLLSFKYLSDWIFAEMDVLRDKRHDIIEWSRNFVDAYESLEDASVLASLKEALGYSEKYNSEQIAAKLLYEITRNTGFETNKGTLGKCFVLDCCTWDEKQSDDICGLENKPISFVDKMKTVYEESILKDALIVVGL